MKSWTSLGAALLTLCLTQGQLTADTFGSGANQFAIDFVTIGNPGNAADMTGNPNPAGSVAYTYRIAKYEISREMVELSNVEGSLGIVQLPLTFVNGGPRPAMPAMGLSWNQSARFVNWLNTSSGYSPAYKFATQSGDTGYDANENILLWQASDPGFNPANPFRNSDAYYFLSSADEWYKAAYYDPSDNDGAGGYWDFPTGSDTAPLSVTGGTAPETAVFGQFNSQGPADIDFAGGLSPYGVMGLGGNAWEWQETSSSGINDDPTSPRSRRGGDFRHGPSPMTSAVLPQAPPFSLGHLFGIRLASVPEPVGTHCLIVAISLYACQNRRYLIDIGKSQS